MTEFVIAGLAVVVAMVLTLLAGPQLAERFAARRAARHPEPKVTLPALPAVPPMERRYLAVDYRVMADAMHGRGAR
jgi:hypothetical protein